MFVVVVDVVDIYICSRALQYHPLHAICSQSSAYENGVGALFVFGGGVVFTLVLVLSRSSVPDQNEVCQPGFDRETKHAARDAKQQVDLREDRRPSPRCRRHDTHQRQPVDQDMTTQMHNDNLSN